MSSIKCVEIEEVGRRCVSSSGELLETDLVERANFLRKIQLFSSLSERQLGKVSDLVRDRCFCSDEYICRQGDKGVSSFIIFQGEVEVHKEVGADRIVYIAGVGEVIGEMAVLADIPRTASLKARGDVHLLEIHGEDFIGLLHKNPEISVKLLKLLVNRLVD